MLHTLLIISQETRRRLALPLGAVAVALIAVASDAADKPTPSLSEQTFTLVQESGINAKPNTAFDVKKTVTLKKGQMLVLKSSSGQMIEVAGPYHGKPLDHYTPLVGNATMGFDPHSFGQHGHCGDTSGGSHPSGGPNPDETAGSEATATHCH